MKAIYAIKTNKTTGQEYKTKIGTLKDDGTGWFNSTPWDSRPIRVEDIEPRTAAPTEREPGDDPFDSI